MIRIALRQLRGQSLTWLGTFAACLMTSFALSLAFNLQASIDRLPGEDFGSYAFPIVALTLITGIVVTGTSVSLAVEATRNDFALLSLAGLAPAQAAGAIFLQATSVALFGAIGGVLLAVPLTPSVIQFVILKVLELRVVPSPAFAAQPVLVILLVVMAAGISCSGGARIAARVSPQVMLRGVAVRHRTMGVIRWIAMAAGILLTTNAVLLLVTGGQIVNLLDPPRSEEQALMNSALAVINGSMFLLISVTILFAAVAPLAVHGAARLWTSAIPTMTHVSWLIAKRSALAEPTRSAAAVTPLVVGVVIVAGVFSLLTTMNLAMEGQPTLSSSASSDINVPSVLTVVAGPLSLAFLAALLSIMIDTRRRRQEITLYRLSGSTWSISSAASILEAFIYAVTAILLGLLLVGVVVMIASAVLTAHGLPAAPDIAFSIIGSIAGLGGCALAVILITLPSSRSSFPTGALRHIE